MFLVETRRGFHSADISAVSMTAAVATTMVQRPTQSLFAAHCATRCHAHWVPAAMTTVAEAT